MKIFFFSFDFISIFKKFKYKFKPKYMYDDKKLELMSHFLQYRLVSSENGCS